MKRCEGLVEFMAVVETGSFSGAARQLGASVAHISRQIAALEGRLQTTLFVRNTRRVIPTPAGLHLAQQTKPLLEDIARVQESLLLASDSLEGPIRISLAGHFAKRHVVPAIAGFCAAHPNVRIDLDFSAHKVDLLDGYFDLAVRMGPEDDSVAVVARPYAEMPMITLANPALVERVERSLGEAVSPLNVRARDCLALSGRPWHFRRAETSQAIRPDGLVASNSADALMAAAAAGLGFVHVPVYYMADAQRVHGLRKVFCGWQTEDSVVFNIVYARNRFMPSRVRRLIDHLLSSKLCNWVAGE